MPHTLFCAILGHKSSFSVKINKTQTVHELKDEIKVKNAHALASIDASTLTLYLVNIDVPTEEDFKKAMQDIYQSSIKLNDEMASVFKLSKYFKQSASEKTIHILVQLPTGKRKRGVDDEEEEGSYSPSKRLRAENHAAFEIAMAKPAPSSVILVGNLAHAQKRNPILNARPHSACGPPVTLYEPTFAHFRREVKKAIDLEIPPNYYRTVASFLVASSDIYSNEATRRDELLPILMKLLSQPIIFGGTADGSKSDGVCTTKMDLGEVGMYALLMLWELKNEHGSGGGDASVEASFSFSRWWAQNRMPHEWYSRGLCASFLLTIAGPWVSVHGGILLGRDWITQPLTDYVWAGAVPGIELDGQVARVARLFYSLRTALKDLESKYRTLASTDRLSLPCYPYITSYGEDPNSKRITYKERLHCSDLRKATSVFAAEDAEGTALVVKFTYRYNDAAHELLARNGYAPHLRHCAETIAGSGCLMVVMDRIHGKDMFGCSFTADDLRRVQEAKELLHRHNFVFGDLRPNNIVKPADGSGVVLVDFDWCALAGEGTYPLTINGDPSCGWHPDVAPGVIMCKEHDDYLLEDLKEDV